MQETYLDGMSQDESVPFSVTRQAARDLPYQRRKVAGGAAVIDMQQMIAGLEANPEARKRS